MAAKKKTKKKSAKSKTPAARKVGPAKRAPKRKASKKLTEKKAAPKKATARKKSLKKATRGKTAGASSKQTRSRRPARSDTAFSGEALGPDSGGQSGDLQGLSNVEAADSESVDELIDEGNAFEAGVVSGVEEAGNEDGREVHTREVPEDDVPGEYLDED
jgi:RNA polymerase primary sigma factor